MRAVAVTQAPEPPVQTSLTEVSEEDHGHQMPKLTVKQRQEKLSEELDLSGLESWPPNVADCPVPLGCVPQCLITEAQ